MASEDLRLHCTGQAGRRVQRGRVHLFARAQVLGEFPKSGQSYTTKSGREARILMWGHYRIVYIQPSEPLAIDIQHIEGISGLDSLSEAELALLRAAQPTGRLLVVWGGGRHGRGPAASALVLVKEPLKTSVCFQQPDRTTAVYLQEDQRFAIYPPTTKTLDREITLSPQEDGLWCSVRIANGGVQSGPVRIW